MPHQALDLVHSPSLRSTLYISTATWAFGERGRLRRVGPFDPFFAIAHASNGSCLCICGSRGPLRARIIAAPTAPAKGGGNAFPTCRYAAALAPAKDQPSR